MNAPATSAEVALPTVIDRARTALSVTPERDKALTELAAKSAGIVKITNGDAYKECHAARMALKTERIAMEKSGKVARADAKAFADAVIAEERRLIGFIEPEEKRLQALQDAEDRRVEAEKQAKIEAEAARVRSINQRIDWLRACVTNAVGKTAAQLSAELDDLEALPITKDLYAEFIESAIDAHKSTVEKLRFLHAQAVGNEAEAVRLAEQKRKLDEQQAEIDRQARERATAVKKEDDDRRAAHKAEDDARAAVRKAEDDERARLQKIEDDRKAEERAAEQRKEDAARAERERVEQEAAAERKRERARVEVRAQPWAVVERVHAIAIGADGKDDVDADQRLDEVLSIAADALRARDELVALDHSSAAIEDATEIRR